MKVGLEKRKLKLGRLDRRLLKKKNTDLLHAKCAHHIALFSGPAIRIREDMFERCIGYVSKDAGLIVFIAHWS